MKAPEEHNENLLFGRYSHGIKKGCPTDAEKVEKI